MLIIHCMFESSSNYCLFDLYSSVPSTKDIMIKQMLLNINKNSLSMPNHKKYISLCGVSLVSTRENNSDKSSQ